MKCISQFSSCEFPYPAYMIVQCKASGRSGPIGKNKGRLSPSNINNASKFQVVQVSLKN